MTTTKTIQTKCENILNQLFWLLLLLPARGLGTLVRTRILNPLSVAYRAVLTFLVSSSTTIAVNHRLYIAIVFMLVIAPLSNVGYLLFDQSEVIEGWYYVNHFYLFYILSPWIALGFFSTGLFLLFPEGSRRAYFLAIPIASAFTRIMWLSHITSNEQFHLIPAFDIVFEGFSIAFIWLFCVDYLMARKYHKYDGIIARCLGLLQIGEMKLLEKEIKKLQSFPKQD